MNLLHEVLKSFVIMLQAQQIQKRVIVNNSFCIISQNFTNSWDAERKRIDRILETQINKLSI